MTDSEKMDLILTKLANFDERFDKIESEMQGMKKKIERLSSSQSEIQKEMYIINRKLSDTYNMALDALGTSAENIIRLEKGTLVK